MIILVNLIYFCIINFDPSFSDNWSGKAIRLAQIRTWIGFRMQRKAKPSNSHQMPLEQKTRNNFDHLLIAHQ